MLLVEEQILCVCRALGAHRGEASKQTNMTDSGFRTRLRQPLQGHQLDSAMTTGKKFVGEGLRLEESHGFLSYGVFMTREPESAAVKYKYLIYQVTSLQISYLRHQDQH